MNRLAGAVCLLLVLLTASCGGSGQPVADDGEGSDTVGSSGLVASTVVSDDGLVRLEVPDGAIPDPGAVSISAAAVPDTLVVEGADVLVYDLEPSGLEFEEPATLTLTLPREAEGIVLGVVGIGDGLADLEHVPATFSVDDGTVTVTTEVDHFSKFVSWIGGEELTVIDECPQEMIVGGPLCSIHIEDFDEHPGLRASIRVPERGEPFFFETQERPEGSLFGCENPTDGGEYFAYVTVTVSDWTLEELFRLVGAKLEYRGGDGYDDFEYFAFADCVVEDPFFDDDPASQIAGGIAVTVADPTGDFLSHEDLTNRGFELIEEDPPAGLDVVEVAVAYAPGGDVTEITVTFAGPARGLSGEGRTTSIRPVVLRGGEYLFEAHYENGQVFLSGGPQGATVTHTWTADDQIRIRIEGFAPQPGDGIRLDVFSRLATGEDEAVQGDTAIVAID